MSSQITKSARKDHGPCRSCMQPILKGQSFRRSLMEHRRWMDLWPGESVWRGSVTIKYHLTCIHPDSRRNPYWMMFQWMSGVRFVTRASRRRTPATARPK
jgi:hypothetical protein